jgi:hypothetical protein
MTKDQLSKVKGLYTDIQEFNNRLILLIRYIEGSENRINLAKVLNLSMEVENELSYNLWRLNEATDENE